MTIEHRPDSTEALQAALAERILVLDGAMGTMIQARAPSAADYHGERFKDHPSDLKGDNDLLTLTQPEMILDIHRAFVAAGADVVETNTFNSTRASQSDYDLEDLVPELNREGARLARRAADEAMAENPQRTVWVAGVGHFDHQRLDHRQVGCDRHPIV